MVDICGVNVDSCQNLPDRYCQDTGVTDIIKLFIFQEGVGRGKGVGVLIECFIIQEGVRRGVRLVFPLSDSLFRRGMGGGGLISAITSGSLSKLVNLRNMYATPKNHMEVWLRDHRSLGHTHPGAFKSGGYS